MVKNFIDKYLVLKEEDTTHFYLIMPRNDMYFLVSGTSVKAEIQVVHCKNTGEALKEINAFVLSKRKQGYRDEARPEDISVFSIALAQLKTENAQQFEEKLLVLKMLTDAYYTREGHPFVEYLGVDMKDEELVTIPILDEYLQKHIDTLSSSALVSVFQMTLQNIYFNFEATSFAVEEIVKRKDLTVQLEIVEQFYEACEYYDAGHRFWSSTNQDELIDTYFPEFESEALLKILEKASEDMLKTDEMDELFVPALRGTEDKSLQLEILNVLSAYKKEYEEYVEEEYFDALFEKILESASVHVKQGIERIREGKKRRDTLLKAIKKKDLEQIEKSLDQGVIPDEAIFEEVIESTLKKKDVSIIRLFKNKGFECNPEELFRNAKEHVDILIECIESDLIDPGYRTKESNKNLLFFVIESKPLIEALLKNGVDINHTDNEGNTVLRKVCTYAKNEDPSYIAIVQLFLEYKADPNSSVATDGWEKGMTPLYNAVENEAIEIVKLLIHAGANVNAMANNGRNPLLLAHKVGNSELIELLTQANATAPKREILKIQFMRCASNQQWDKLVVMEEEILSEYPKEFSILLNLAQAHYFTGGNYTKASLYAKKALSLQPDNASLNILFMSLIRLGQIQQVIDIFIRNKENFKPQKNLSDNIIANLIVAYCASNQLKEGIEVLSPYFGEVTESRRERGVMNFNIACMYALDNNIHEMLPYVIEALERQYTKEDFLNESDFAAYHEDELFLFVLDHDHKNTIELEEYTEDVESNTFKKIKIKAYYNNNSFSFEDEKHEVVYEKGTIGEEKKRTQERLYISKAQALAMYFMKLKKMEKEDKDMYFILKEDTSLDTEVKIHPPKDLSDNLDFLCGNKITMSGTDPIEFTTNAKAGDTIPDFVNGKIPVMSKQFLDLLREAGVDTLQTFPAIIKSKKGGTVCEDYFAVNLLETIACGAFPASIFKEKGPSHGIFCELAIDAEKANEALLFRLEEHLPTIIMHRSVPKYLVDNDPDEKLIWDYELIIQ